MPTAAVPRVLLELLRSRKRGVLATIKRDGRPQLSNVAFKYDEAAELIRISVTADLAKTRNLRRDPRACFHLTSDDMGSYAVVEAHAELSPVARDPSDATVEELYVLYRDLWGEHPDWAEYRTAMVTERRLVIRLHVERVYGWSRDL